MPPGWRIPQAPPPSSHYPFETRGNEAPAGMLALTFDDGPNRRTTPGLLALLARYQAPATFFMLGQQVKLFPQLAREVADQGFAVGAHSMDHRKLTKLTAAQLDEQVSGSQKLIAGAIDRPVRLFRAPYGSRDRNVMRAIDAAGMSHVLWSIDSRDWQDRDPASVTRRIVQALTKRPHGIVLLHDIHPTTLTATRMLLDAIAPLRASGHIRLVTVPELLVTLAAAP